MDENQRKGPIFNDKQMRHEAQPGKTVGKAEGDVSAQRRESPGPGKTPGAAEGDLKTVESNLEERGGR